MSARPAHAKAFRGGAKIIPAQDTFFLGYQDKWIKDKAIMKLMEKGRRIGISYSTAYERSREHALKTRTLDTWASSRDEATARQFVRDCATFARVFNLGAKEVGERVLLTDDGEKVTVHTLPFANNTAIFSVASNPDVFAGKGGDVLLDEFALRKDPGGVFGIAKPTIDWGGRLSIISTHRGSGNYFNTLCREIREKGNPKGFSHHKVTLQTALDDGFLWKLQSKLQESDPRFHMDEAAYFDYQRNGCRDKETFLQEYMCEPADDAAAFIEYALLDACTYKEGIKWDLRLEDVLSLSNKGAEFYAGIDIGRVKNLTAFTVLQRILGEWFVVKRIDLQNKPFSEQEAMLYPWIAAMRRTCIDQTGIGRQFTERCQERFGKYKVEGITFTAPVKETLAYPVRAAFEDRAIRIPFEDDLIADIRSVRKETTLAGNIRFVVESSDDAHADRFWSIGLAIHAGGMPAGEFGAMSVPQSPRGGRRNEGL